MQTINFKTILAITLLIAVITVFTVLSQQPWQAGASVRAGEEYQSTTTPIVTDLTNLCPARVGMASSTTGILGSIVYTGSNLGSLHIYDATTSNATLRAIAATSTLLLAEIPVRDIGNATSSPVTFTFDVEFKRGLLLDLVSPSPTTTVTYRCEG